MNYGSVTVGSGTAIQVLAANYDRRSVIITNNGDYPVNLGYDSSITTTTGIFLDSLGSLQEDSGGQKVYLGPYYAIAQDSTSVVAYWERTT